MRIVKDVWWAILAVLVCGVVGGVTAAPAAAEELGRYDVVVVGGEGAVSDAVLGDLEGFTTGEVVRISGDDRYATAAAVSQLTQEVGAEVVFVATGRDYPDAMVVGSVAASQAAPVLLVRPDRIPADTRLELERLQPQRVVVLGGEGAVSDAVTAELATLADVERMAGADRYATASAISQAWHPAGAGTVYVATGATFPDGIAAGPGAATDGAPILLTKPGQVPTATRQELIRLAPDRVIVLGGTGSITEEVAAELSSITGADVLRLGGDDRVGTAARVSEHAFPSGAGVVFIATGAAFPDALSIAAATGAPRALWTAAVEDSVVINGPVLLAHQDRLPSETATELRRLASAEPVAEPQLVQTQFETPVNVTLAATGGVGPLTFTVTSHPSNGALSGTAPNLTYTPNDGFVGADSFEFTVGARPVTSEPATVSLEVVAVPPVAHGQEVEVVKNEPVVITLVAESLSGGDLTYHYSPPDHGTLSGTGPEVTYTPEAGFEGADSFSFYVNDGYADSNTATVALTVQPPAPVAHEGAGSTDQDQPVTITLMADNFSNNPLTYHYTQPADGTVTGDGPEVTYTPDAGFFGTDSFTFHVNDGFHDSNTATIALTVQPLAPVAHDQEVEVVKDQPVVITLVAESLSGGDLTYHYTAPDHGTLSGTGPEVTYTPEAGFEGADSFSFYVNDGYADSNTATVGLTVQPPAPVAHEGTASTDQDQPVTITLMADNSSNNPLTYHYTQPADGTVTGEGPEVTYTPEAGFFGTDSFTFHVNDGFHDSNTATIALTVQPDPGDHAFEAVGNTLLEVGVDPSGAPAVTVDASLLDNVTGLIVTGVDTTGTAGAVSFQPDGGFTYQPALGYTGDDTFGYTVGDGEISATGTVTVTVTDLVWYVDNTASGDGRSWSPAPSLAAGQAASGPGDTVFAYPGSGAYTTGITLQPGQHLLGQPAGLSIGGHDLVAPGGTRPTINAATGNAIGLAGGTVVQAVDITGAAGHGLAAVGVSGTATVAQMAIAGVTGNGVHVSGGSLSLTASANVTSSTQHSVQVTGLVNGAVALSGSVTDTGSGISLTGNTGSTIAFTGPLTVSTEGTTAFTATGGGTVTASNTTSTLAATNARALQVSGTAIGTQGLHFRSVSATNSVHGIEVTNAGAGHLVVSGDGSTNRNGTGGTISGMSSHGVALSSSGPATLRSLNVQGSGGAGIRAQSTAGLTVVAGALTDNTSDVNNPLTRNSIQLHEVTGTARLEATLVEDSVHNQIDVENSSGALTLEVIDTTVRDNGINSGLLLDAVGTSSVTLNVEGSTISDHHATAVHAFASDTADLTVNVADNTFSGNNVAVNVAAQDTATAASTVTDNTIGGHTSHNINITVHDDGVHNATVTDNVIDGSATIASVGIRLIAENDGVLRGVVTDNTVTGQTTGHGFRVIAREQAGQVHLVLADNHMVSTSASPAYSLEILEESTLCAAIVGNTGSSSHFSRDLFIDLFDSGASGQFEGLSPGPVTQAQLVAFLSAQNPPMRAGAFVASPPNAFGVAAGTCERP